MKSFSINCQSLIPYLPELIDELKGTSVPIYTKIEHRGEEIQSLGSGVVIEGLEKNRFFVVTCNHVIVGVDSLSNERSNGPYYALLNHKDSTSHPYELIKIHSNKDTDICILEIKPTKNIKEYNSLHLKYVQKSRWVEKSSLRVGEFVFAIGYPAIGSVLGSINHPITQSTMIAQLNPEAKNFLVDRPFQSGQSGSPVYRMEFVEKESKNFWNAQLIGIVTSYPNLISGLYFDTLPNTPQHNRDIKYPVVGTVIPMDEILKMISQ